jgi:hypothetical protein
MIKVLLVCLNGNLLSGLIKVIDLFRREDKLTCVMKNANHFIASILMFDLGAFACLFLVV